MGDPIFGVTLRQIDEEARPVVAADLSTIGIIGPMPGADVLAFPLNACTLVNSNDKAKLALMGTTGYVPDSVIGINDQLAETQFAARIVVIRTALGTNVNPAIALQETINNIVGSSLSGTGIHAFLTSAAQLGVTPRIIIAPGYTGQMANGVSTITRNLAGSGYIQDQSYPITFTGGGATAVQAIGHAFGQAGGTLGPVVLDLPGAWYTTVPTVTAPVAGQKVTVAVLAAAGTGYAVGEVITLANGVKVTVLTITGGGGTGPIGTISINDAGFLAAGVTPPANPALQVSSTGAGGNATFTLTWANIGTAATYTATIAQGANPVIASLPGVLNPILAHAIVESAGTDQDNDNDWRETFQSERIIPISGGVRVMDPVTSSIVFRPAAPRMAGIMVRRDHETGAPFHSAANQPVQGIIGPMREMGFAITDDASEAQELLRNNIGVIIRGEIGDDFSIASGGFVLISTDNAGEDELWRFYNVKRGRDFILLSTLRSVRFFLGRYNIIGHTVQAILNTIYFMLRDLKADQHILGGKVNFETAGNSPEQIRAGKLTVSFAAEEPPVLRHLTVEHARYRPAIDAMVADLASQLNMAVA